MATFYGGEQLSQNVTLTGTFTTNFTQITTVYVIPTGFYGLLKWVYIGRNDSSFWGNSSNCSGYIVPKNLPNTGNEISNHAQSVSSQTDVYSLQRLYFRKNDPSPSGNSPGDLLDRYLQAGDRIVFLNNGSGNNVRWEIELHLFKNP